MLVSKLTSRRSALPWPASRARLPNKVYGGRSRGGINATLKGGKSATVADSLRPRSDLQRELEDAEQQIQDTKAAYYAALTARHRALRALAHQLAC